MGSGRRIPIRFDNGVKLRGGAEGAEKMGFFPGKIVALKGKNASGSSGYFVVDEIITVGSNLVRRVLGFLTQVLQDATHETFTVGQGDHVVREAIHNVYCQRSLHHGHKSQI